MKKLLLILALLLLAKPVYASPIRGMTVFQTINEVRKENHLRPLVPNAALVKAAQAKADDMVKNRYFAHRTPDGKNMLKFVIGYRYRDLGENLANGFVSVEALRDGWINSPTHRENILSPDYADTGIGIASDGKNLFIVQYFGRSR